MFHVQSLGKKRTMAIVLTIALVFMLFHSSTVTYANELDLGTRLSTEEGANSETMEGNSGELDEILIDTPSEADGDTEHATDEVAQNPTDGVAKNATDEVVENSTDQVAQLLATSEPELEVSVHNWDVTTLDSNGVVDKAILAEALYENYFKVFGTVIQRVSSSTGHITSIEVDKALKGGVQFTVIGTADVVVDMSSTGGTNTSPVALVDQSNNVVMEQNKITTVTGTSKTTLMYKELAAGTYKIVSPSNVDYNRGARIYSVTVTEVAGERPERKAWDEVVAPVITSAVAVDGKVTVSFDMEIGYDGADSVTVTMKEDGETVDIASYASDGSNGVVTFTPSASGDYTFSITAKRDESIKAGADYALPGFVYPLATPNMKAATSTGNGAVLVSWDAVKEANGYEVSYQAAGDTIPTVVGSVTDTVKEISGLVIGTTYTFYVKAVRGLELSSAAEITATIVDEAQRPWYFSAYGEGVNLVDNNYTGNINEGSVTVASENGKGKLIPASTDGLAFYYTTIDPATENFILTATVKVDSWYYSNGQEGFGLMVADAVGTNGNSNRFWNNSYMNSVTKVEYLWDAANQKVSDAGDKITMKLGIGAQEKIGVTAANMPVGATTPEGFKSSMTTLETSTANSGAGTYNIVGNYTNTTGTDDLKRGCKDQISFDLTIQRDNTGYRLSYTDPQGNKTSKLFYDLDRNALTQIDADNMYLGIFASRNAKITVTDMDLTITDPATDPPAEERDITYVTPSYNVVSTTAVGVPSYELSFLANADGLVTIKDSNQNVIASEEAVIANTMLKKQVTLLLGSNDYTITFTPDQNYKPSEYERLSSYEAVTFTHSVVYKHYNRNVLYVSPSGSSSGTGSKSSPLDIYTAVKHVKPGQTIVLAGGTYNLTSTVIVARGIDGTASQKIIMMGDPSSSSRPVLDFNKLCAGMIVAGDYWYLKGFDVTRSSNTQKGIQVSGNHNVLDQVNAYYNGNTGIQLSRYITSDHYEDWPANNLILNCTAYGNADNGYEDADGFAAKLTIGDGNVFDGCIAYNNADDGWDLFAKVETGPIGKVVVKNCVAYGNGYLPDGTNAGNGNGFKLGGSSITGYHTLINSIAFNNKAKGIDSNSCPDIQVYNCTTYNNQSYNVAFYTNEAANTDFLASGILSYRTDAMSVAENLKEKGTQVADKIYGPSNYYWNVASQTSKNSLNGEVAADWFVSLDTNIPITRNSNGTIHMGGLLELTDKAAVDAGARISGTSSLEIEIPQDSNDATPVPDTTTPPSTQVLVASNHGVVLEVAVDNSGKPDWNQLLLEIKKTMNANSNMEGSTMTVVLNKTTVVPKEIFETVMGKDTSLALKVGEGITWTMNGRDMEQDGLRDINLAVQQGTHVVPQTAIQSLLQPTNSPSLYHQISLAYEGEFHFTAKLSIDFSKVIDQFSASSSLDMDHLIASIYYYNPKTKELTLQSASRVEDGVANFSFSHASDYVISFRNEVLVDQVTLDQIMVNGVTSENTTERTLYIGGTTGKTDQIVTVLPEGVKEAIDKELLEYRVTYSSSDRAVASVYKSGKIVANGVGTATITTQIVVGDQTLVYDTKVTVKKAFVEFIQTSKELQIGEKATYKIAVHGYAVGDVIWRTNKKGIAAVGKNIGRTDATVYAKSEGLETVYVKVLKANGTYLYVKSSLKVVDPAKTQTLVYVVKKGDALWKIASKYNCTVSEIVAANRLEDASLIKIGQKLNIPQE